MIDQILAPYRKYKFRRTVGSDPWPSLLMNRLAWSEITRGNDGKVIFRRLNVALSYGSAKKILPRYAILVELVQEHGAVLRELDGRLIIDMEGASYIIDTPEEIFILKEIYVQGLYGWKPRRESVLLDIGMNVAMSAIHFARFSNVQVLGFEPFKDTFNCAQANLALNPARAARVRTFNVGVSDFDRTEEWEYVPDQRGSCGAFPIPFEVATSERQNLKVELRSIESILTWVDKEWPDFDRVAKIDCEGSEYPIIDALIGGDRLRSFDFLMIEWHRRAGRGPEDLEASLRSNGFVTFQIGPYGHEIGMLYALNRYGTR